MAKLQVYKAEINNACYLIKSIEADVKRLDNPFTFPEERIECEEFVRTKAGELTHLLTYHPKCLQSQFLLCHFLSGSKCLELHYVEESIVVPVRVA
ncbi:hypothetical protein Y032_0889g2877 [Ancylostoma ceylanicum]|uniref:Uncharacterized protein n=1 Tax=Ancylostoma ceylanicum TaxID=53326 RepID=A0A016WBY2_9BILA|nr:hypothetical protein Y032_0889g2877 [Ancylostoma ceylanicum]